MSQDHAEPSDQMKVRLDRRAVVKAALIRFLPLFGLIIVLLGGYFLMWANSDLKILRQREITAIELARGGAKSKLGTVFGDLLFLSRSDRMDQAFSTNDPAAWRELGEQVQRFAATHDVYDQVRLLDEHGMERVRVNRSATQALIVPDTELQDKKGRYYFEDSFAMNRDGIYVSPFDLNLEHGAIEQPIKPVIRFGTPVFDSRGGKRGVLLFNFLGKHLLEVFEELEPSSKGSLMLLNGDGHWCRAPEAELEWAFMYKDRKDRSFANRYPEAWQRVLSDHKGQFKTGDGIFTFETIAPPRAGAGEPDERFWIAVSFVPKAVYLADQRRLAGWLLLFGTVATVLAGLGCWRLEANRNLHRRHEKALHKAREDSVRSKRLLDAMIEYLPDNIYFKDTESRFLLVSRRLANHFGASDPAEVVGKTDFDFFNREHAEDAYHDEREMMRTGVPIIGKEENEVYPDGSERWALTTKLCLRDAGGKVIGTFGLSRDITDIKKAEQATVEARIAAEEANRAKSDFLANMSHEIRTPMNGVIGMAELLLDTELSSRQRGHLQVLLSSAEALLDLLNDILDFSKIEAGHLEFEDLEFDLRESLGDTLQTLAVRAEQKGLELAFHIPSEVPRRLIADAGRLRQVIVNLVGNAIKFTEEGEVVVDVQPGPVADGEVELHFTVRDTGIGIPADKHEGVFEHFTQADASTTRRFGGTGLGLAISREIIGKMGGRVWLESEVGKGTTFHFTPRLRVADAAPARRLQHEAWIENTHVLIVDDNDTNRLILTEILSNWGIAAISCSSGEEALAAIGTADAGGRPVNLVLTDAMMPGMDGFELTRKIRDLPVGRRPQIIMLSSAASRAGTDRAEGIARYLVKPVKQSSLFDAMIEIMSPAHRDEAMAEPVGDAGPALAILLAEDNRVNQKVARGMLERRGHAVTLARDGREAVDAFARDRFDVILMDIQMPHMNGFEATAAIRERERALGGHVPIIAMTANAMKGDREKCLGAGMDDYVHKPVRSKTLYQALERNAPPGEDSEREGSDRPADEAVAAKEDIRRDGDEPAEVDADVFDAERFRKNSGDDELMRTLLDIFDEEADQCSANIDKAVAIRDAEALHHAAHALKGMVGNFCADRVFNCIRDLDDKTRRGELDAACRMVPDVNRELERLRAALKAFRECLR